MGRGVGGFVSPHPERTRCFLNAAPKKWSTVGVFTFFFTFFFIFFYKVHETQCNSQRRGLQENRSIALKKLILKCPMSYVIRALFTSLGAVQRRGSDVTSYGM